MLIVGRQVLEEAHEAALARHGEAGGLAERERR
jgi:hypothetical protein